MDLPSITTIASPSLFKELTGLIGPIKLLATFSSFFIPNEAYKSRIGIWVFKYLVVDKRLSWTQVIKQLFLIFVYYWMFSSGFLVACGIAGLLADLIGHYVYQDKSVVRRRIVLGKYIKSVSKK